MATIHPSSGGHAQPDRAPYHKSKVRPDGFIEHSYKVSVLKSPLQPPDPNPIKHIWEVVKREIRIQNMLSTSLEELRDTITARIYISKGCF